MTLFLLVSAPLTAYLAYTVFVPAFGGVVLSAGDLRARALRNPLIAGALAFIPMYALYSVLDEPAAFGYSPAALYLHALVRDYLGWFGLAAAVSFVVVRPLRGSPAAEQYLAHLSFLVVPTAFLAVAEFITGDSVWTIYELFLKPIARSVMLIIFSIGLTVADGVRGGGWAVLGLIVIPALAALVPMWHNLLQPGSAVLSLVALLVLSGGTVWLLLYRGAGS
jgi:hypothetical protein